MTPGNLENKSSEAGSPRSSLSKRSEEFCPLDLPRTNLPPPQFAAAVQSSLDPQEGTKDITIAVSEEGVGSRAEHQTRDNESQRRKDI